jgi:hypothetical protein
MKSRSVNGIIEVLGSTKATINTDIVPIIPPRIIKIFRPYLPKKSMVGPKINFNIQGTETIPPTRVVVVIDISFSVKNKTIITVVSAHIKPSEKYRVPNKTYFNRGYLERLSI